MARPFYISCIRQPYPGFNHGQRYADAELALTAWNRRVQLPPETRETVAEFFGFTKKNLIRGEMISLSLDRTGVLISDQIEFSPKSQPLMRKSRE